MMKCKVVIIRDPEGIAEKERHFLEPGTKLLDWLIEQYGTNGFTVPTQIHLNGELIDLKDYICTGCPVNENDLFIIEHRPQGIEVFVASFLLAVILAAVIPVPEVPEFTQSLDSPNNNNNSISKQTNIARALQRIPDIYGRQRVFPDLVAKTYFEYINHIKFQYEYLCIGRGEFEVGEIKSEDTLIDEIDGSGATVYEPFSDPARLLDVTESNSVKKIRLYPVDTPGVVIASAEVEFIAGNQFQSTDDAFATFQQFDQGDTFTISNSETQTAFLQSSSISFQSPNQITSNNNFGGFAGSIGDSIRVTGTAANDGVKGDLLSIIGGDDALIVSGSITNEGAQPNTIVEAFNSNDGTYTFQAVEIIPGTAPLFENTYIVTVQENSFEQYTAPAAAFDSVDFLDNESGFFVVPGNPEQVWIDLTFPRGLQRDNGGLATCNFTIILQEIDENGNDIGGETEFDRTVSDETTDARFYTFKVTCPNPGGLYKCKIRINTLYATNIDDFFQIEWTRLAGMVEILNPDYGNVTTVFVQTQATDQVASQQRRRFNAICTRKLVTYDTNTQTVTTTPEPTARFADAVLNMLTDPAMGNKPLNEIDLDGLYSIQESLDNDPIYGDTLGRFCYTFSSDRVPLSDELATIMNAVRGFAYREGNFIRFRRDALQQQRVTLFNKRNKKPESETKKIKFQKPDDFDAVELEWQDEETGNKETIFIPETGFTNPRRIKTAGIKNFPQAWNRAKYEFAKLQLQRTTVDTTVTHEGLLVQPLDRVASVDATNYTKQDGEIVAIDGNLMQTSEPVMFTGGGATVILRAADGAVSEPLQVAQRTDGVQGFELLDSPGFDIFIRGTDGLQIGTIYTFEPDNNHAANDYQIQAIEPGDDGYVRLTMINYNADIYAADFETPPIEG